MRPMIRRTLACAMLALAASGHLAGHETAVNVVSTAQTAAGELDPTFSGDGRQTTDFGGDDYSGSVAVQADGKILVAGQSDRGFALARYNADGALDITFSDDGKVIIAFGGQAAAALDVAIQADGKIVAAGYAGIEFALVRFNADGTLDMSFDSDGMQTTSFVDGAVAYASGVALQDGKIVVAGSTEEYSASEFVPFPPFDLALARYNADGTLDTSFSGDGKQVMDFGGSDFGEDVAIQADGKIVVAGAFTDAGGSGGHNSALARYNADGTLDTSFGIDGKQTTDFGGYLGGWDRGRAVAIQPDGEIVVVGTNDAHPVCYCADSRPDFALARCRSGSGPSETAPPDTTVTGGPTGTTSDSTPTFSFDSSEVGSTFACRVDDSPFFTCSSPHTISTLSDGPHSFEVRATDAAGNADPSPAGRGFSVDTAAPDTTVTGGPAGTTNSNSPTFMFDSSEGDSTFGCRLDGGVFFRAAPRTRPRH